MAGRCHPRLPRRGVAQAEGRAKCGFAGGAGVQQLLGAEKRVVFEKVRQHERGDEQRPEQALQILGLRSIRRIGGAALVLVIRRRE